MVPGGSFSKGGLGRNVELRRKMPRAPILARHHFFLANPVLKTGRNVHPSY
jgi:hypothetical protein